MIQEPDNLNHQFASFKWQSRWNNSSVTSMIDESRDELMLVNCMGAVWLRKEDASALAAKLIDSGQALMDFVNPSSNERLTRIVTGLEEFLDWLLATEGNKEWFAFHYPDDWKRLMQLAEKVTGDR